MNIPLTALCVDGRHVAADLFGQMVIQDDDGELWVAHKITSTSMVPLKRNNEFSGRTRLVLGDDDDDDD